MFLYHKWLGLPLPTRIKIASQFGIIKKGSTEVFNNEIKSDGYVIKVIEQALNIDALQAYIGTHETDMMVLWMWLVEKIEGKELTQMNMDTTFTPDQSAVKIGDFKLTTEASYFDGIVGSSGNTGIVPAAGQIQEHERIKSAGVADSGRMTTDTVPNKPKRGRKPKQK